MFVEKEQEQHHQAQTCKECCKYDDGDDEPPAGSGDEEKRPMRASRTKHIQNEIEALEELRQAAEGRDRYADRHQISNRH